MEIAEAEEQLAVLLLSVAAGELLLRDEAIQALQVSLQALQGQQRVRLAFRPCRDSRGSEVSLQALRRQQRVRLAFRPCRDNRGSG